MMGVVLLCWAVVQAAGGSLYELLEVSEKATSDEMKKAFRRLSVKYHPDRNTGDQSAQVRYVEIKQAYETLMDVSKRIIYDLHGEQGLEELEKRPLRKGGDFRTEMQVPLEKFYRGGQLVFSFRRGEICKHCKGTGDASAQKRTCSSCHGSGQTTRQVQVKGELKQMQIKCKQCGGTGFGSAHKCPVCQGERIKMAPRDLSFEVERGMQGGDVIHFKGESEQGFDFYPGDVYVKLQPVLHHAFERDGNDLLLNLRVSLRQAILGFERNLQHLDGHAVYLEEENIQDGQLIVIRREGMPIRGELDSFGDLIAKVSIRFNRHFSPTQLQQIQQIFLNNNHLDLEL